MLDLLPVTTGAPGARPPPVFRPPPKFRPPIGTIRNVKLRRETPTLQPGRLTSAQIAGIRYETAAKLFLKQKMPYLKTGVWFDYEDDEAKKLIQLDALIDHDHQIVIIEIKRSHCLEAWWQLRQLYQPVISAWRPGAETRVVEVCHSFDPDVIFPEPPTLIGVDTMKDSGDLFYVMVVK